MLPHSLLTYDKAIWAYLGYKLRTHTIVARQVYVIVFQFMNGRKGKMFQHVVTQGSYMLQQYIGLPSYYKKSSNLQIS